MKVLVHSTTPWGGSSYSVLAKRAVPDLVRMGHEVALSTWYGLQGAPQGWPIFPRGETKGTPPVGSVKILPNAGNTYGTDTLVGIYNWMGADVCIPIMDLWVIPPDVLSQIKACPWMPVDHDPCPDGIRDSARACLYPMVYSQWGTDVLRAAGVDAHYVPCSADSKAFYPVPQKPAREKVGAPADAFLISVVAANKDPGDRKGLAEALQGFARFHSTHADAYLYVHTNWGGPINVGHICDRLGISDHVIRPDGLGYAMGMYDENYMRFVYSASDVLLNPAKSEGFGLPIIESQLCGCPVALTDFSTSRELLSAGWLIPGQRHWSIGADSWRLLASIDGVVDALSSAYDERGNELLRKQARKGTLRYDTATVADGYWRPAMAEIEKLATGAGRLQLVQF